MRIMLIGGNGFMGPYVAEQLAASGHELTFFHRGSKQFGLAHFGREVRGDANRLSDHRAELSRIAPDAVINFILSTGAQAEEMMTALRGIAGRVIALSSMDVYRACGLLHRTEIGELQQLPLTEDSELRSHPAYGPQQLEAGKKIFSWMTDGYDKIPVEGVVLSDPEIPGTVLRLPMVYGPTDPLRRFLPIIKRIADGRKTILLERRNSEFRAPKGFVENVAQAIALAATSSNVRGRVYNIAEESVLTELEWAQLVAGLMKWSGEFAILPEQHMPVHLSSDARWEQHWVPSSRRIRNELGFCENVSREQAVERTIAWELNNPPQELPAVLFNYEAEDAALAYASGSS